MDISLTRSMHSFLCVCIVFFPSSKIMLTELNVFKPTWFHATWMSWLGTWSVLTFLKENWVLYGDLQIPLGACGWMHVRRVPYLRAGLNSVICLINTSSSWPWSEWFFDLFYGVRAVCWLDRSYIPEVEAQPYHWQ